MPAKPAHISPCLATRRFGAVLVDDGTADAAAPYDAIGAAVMLAAGAAVVMAVAAAEGAAEVGDVAEGALTTGASGAFAVEASQSANAKRPSARTIFMCAPR